MRASLRLDSASHDRKITAYGFDDSKNVLAVQMSVDEVVAAGINPWRVDLFHPKPVRMRISGRDLCFSHLDDIAFRCTETQDMHRVCVSEGGRGLFITGTGEPANPFSGALSLTDLHVAPLSRSEFAQQFANWLRLKDRTWNMCTPPAIVRFEKQQLIFDPEPTYIEDSNDGYFDGKMFETLKIAVELPEDISWIFDELGELHPQLFGAAVRNVLIGDHLPHYVDTLIDRGTPMDYFRLNGFGQLRTVAARNPIGAFESTMVHQLYRNNRYYRFFPRDTFDCDLVWPTGHTSVAQFGAVKQGEVLASRIALFDLGRSQFRFTTPFKPSRQLADSVVMRSRPIATPFDSQYHRQELDVVKEEQKRKEV